VWP
jgi:hypothetical protein